MNSKFLDNEKQREAERKRDYVTVFKYVVKREDNIDISMLLVE
jgi:hypothetical protein